MNTNGDVEPPVWLKIMEHGAAGEARTKAFLVDRFWVLDRSVDIDGADFLIQLKRLSSRFTDATPPRIGVVQAKYIQDEGTTHYIPLNYVVDKDGMPLSGFFLLLHVGREDASVTYLLTAKDIVKDLRRTKRLPKRYIVGAAARQEKYRVHSRRLALDQIEHELAKRSVPDAIRFLDRVHIPYRKVAQEDIDFSWILRIPNRQASVQMEFFTQREALRRMMFDMEEAIRAIDEILQTRDPHVALSELEKLNEFRGGWNSSHSLCFSNREADLDWTYLKDALKEHEIALHALDTVGKRQQYLRLSTNLYDQIQLLCEKESTIIDKFERAYAMVDFDIASLSLVRLDVIWCKKGDSAPKKCFGSQSIWAPKDASVAAFVGDQLWHVCALKILHQVCPSLAELE